MVVSWEASSGTRDRLLAIVFGIHIVIIIAGVLSLRQVSIIALKASVLLQRSSNVLYSSVS